MFDPMWRILLRCQVCKSERTVFPRTLIIGPLQEQVVTNRELAHEGSAKLSILHTQPLYKGRVLSVRCPYCDLSVQVAMDLAPHTLRNYLNNEEKQFEGLAIDRLFKMSATQCEIKPFPLDCPRCTRSIQCANSRRHCVDCGSDQVQLIQSEPL